jgi:hypothetical protein
MTAKAEERKLRLLPCPTSFDIIALVSLLYLHDHPRLDWARQPIEEPTSPIHQGHRPSRMKVRIYGCNLPFKSSQSENLANRWRPCTVVDGFEHSKCCGRSKLCQPRSYRHDSCRCIERDLRRHPLCSGDISELLAPSSYFLKPCPANSSISGFCISI